MDLDPERPPQPGDTFAVADAIHIRALEVRSCDAKTTRGSDGSVEYVVTTPSGTRWALIRMPSGWVAIRPLTE
jgi:hypothetical protein